MYRYGDGTPFPFEENFIDTLVAAVDAAVGAFSAAAEIDDRRDKAREARHEAEEELRRFGVMEKAIEAAVFPHRPSADRNATLAQQAAHRALAMSRQAIAAVRAQVEQRLQMLAGEPRTARRFAKQLPAWVFHGAKDDMAHAERFPAKPGLDHLIFPDLGHSDLVPHLKERGALAGLLEAALQEDRRRLLRIAASAGGRRRGKG